MKTKSSILFIVSLFISHLSYAQYWEWARGAIMPSGNCEVEGTVIDDNGYSYTLGSFTSPVIYFDNDSITNSSTVNSFLVKFDSIGNVVWAIGSKGTASNAYKRIEVDGAGNIYLCGLIETGSVIFGNDTLVNNTPNREFILIKFDSDGNLKWMRNAIGYSSGWSLDLDSDANIYAIGYFNVVSISLDGITLNNQSLAPSDFEIFITKYDSSGNIQFVKTFNGNHSEFPMGLTVDNSDNFYVTGYIISSDSLAFDAITINFSGLHDLFLAKYNSAGNCIWATSVVGENGWVSINSDNHSNIYLTGGTPSELIFGNDTVTSLGAGLYDVAFFLAKYDSSGQELWVKQSSEGGKCIGFSITADNNDHLFVTGGFSFQDSLSVSFDSLTLDYPGGEVDPLFLLTYDLNGNILCSETLQSGGDDIAQIAINKNGLIYVGGDFIQNANGDPFVIGNDSLYGAVNNSENFFIAKYHSCFEEETNSAIPVSEENNFMLIPNPASDQITISNSSSEIINWQIINLIGETVKESKTISSEKNISISIKDLSSGIYFLRAETKSEIVSGKFVKE